MKPIQYLGVGGLVVGALSPALLSYKQEESFSGRTYEVPKYSLTKTSLPLPLFSTFNLYIDLQRVRLPTKEISSKMATIDIMTKDLDNSAPVEVKFSNVSYTIPESRKSFFTHSRNPAIQILHSISGHVRAGEFLAILGPSGSGKTTFLNVLAARSQYAPTSGEISFNGLPRLPRTKRHIGYVMQDDVFFPNLTVRDVLQFTADVRLSGILSAKEREERVDHAIKVLRLSHCEDTHVGDQQFHKGISGGERKRLNIANELLHRPRLFIADECTSGLDSSSAFTVIKLLRSLHKQNCTVVSTIHQPSSQMFSVFSNVMFLAEGSVVYFGPPSTVAQYFFGLGYAFPTNAHNPADGVMQIVSTGGAGLSGDFDASADDGEEEQRNRYRTTLQFLTSEWRKRKVEESGESLQSDTDEVTFRKDAENVEVGLPCNEIQATQYLMDVDIGQELSVRNTSAPKECNGALDMPSLHPPTTILSRMERALQKRAYNIIGRRGCEADVDKYSANWWTQVGVLSRRSLRQKRGVILETANIAQAILISLIFVLFWFQIDPTEDSIEDRLGFLSFTCVYFGFTASFSALFTFPTEKEVLNKDRAAGTYRLSAYYFAKTVVDLSADLIIPFVSSCTIYYVVGLNPDIRAFSLYILIVLLHVGQAQGIGIVFAAAFLNIRYAQVGTLAFIIMSMVVSGYYINPENIPGFLEPIRHLSITKVSL